MCLIFPPYSSFPFRKFYGSSVIESDKVYLNYIRILVHHSIFRMNQFYFCSSPSQNSQLAKACRRSISRPFFTIAPCSRPFAINKVSSGLYSRS